MNESYFDKVSKTYSDACSRGIHGYFKKKEARKIVETLARYYESSFEGKALDVGCATGFYSKLLKNVYPSLHFTGLDSSLPMIQKYRKLGFRGIHTDLESMAKSSIEHFDLLLVFGVLEFQRHIEDFVKSLKILSRNESHIFVLVPKKAVAAWPYIIHHQLKNEIHTRSTVEYTLPFDKGGFELIDNISLTLISQLLVFKVKKHG